MSVSDLKMIRANLTKSIEVAKAQMGALALQLKKDEANLSLVEAAIGGWDATAAAPVPKKRGPKPGFKKAAKAAAKTETKTGPTVKVKGAKPQTRVAFVLGLPLDMPIKEVVAKAAAIGIKLSPNYISNIRSASRKAKGAPKKEAKALLMYAFSNEVIESIKIPELKHRITKIIATKLGVNLGFDL